MNREGQLVIATQWEWPGQFQGGVVAIDTNEGKQLFDAKGQPLSKRYEDILLLQGGYAAVMQDGLEGLVDMQGKEIFAPHFETIVSAHVIDGRILARRDGRWQIVDVNGCVQAIQGDGKK